VGTHVSLTSKSPPYLLALQTPYLHGRHFLFSATFYCSACPSEVCDTESLSRATHLTPASISLNDPSHFPYRAQYPIKPEAVKGLKRLIHKFLETGLLIPTNSLYNIQSLPVQRLGCYCKLIQDLD
jgi:hypothetical protein